MATKKADNTEPRRVALGSCTWCGHPPHGPDCGKRIRTGKNTTAPCPCQREKGN